MTDDREIIEAVRVAREKQVRFFSIASKPERERWIVREFLSKLAIIFGEEELISPPEADAVDVLFREASFQTKEIYDPRELRDRELKDDLRRAESATNLQDLFAEMQLRDNRYVDVFPLIVEIASDVRYLPSRARLDLLCYVTRTDATINVPAQLPTELQSWRSVSCLFGSRPMILAAQPTAPSFLRLK